MHRSYRTIVLLTTNDRTVKMSFINVTSTIHRLRRVSGPTRRSTPPGARRAGAVRPDRRSPWRGKPRPGCSDRRRAHRLRTTRARGGQPRACAVVARRHRNLCSRCCLGLGHDHCAHDRRTQRQACRCAGRHRPRRRWLRTWQLPCGPRWSESTPRRPIFQPRVSRACR